MSRPSTPDLLRCWENQRLCAEAVIDITQRLSELRPSDPRFARLEADLRGARLGLSDWITEEVVLMKGNCA